MTVSVVIPVFGPEHFLSACLAALASNTPDHELICVDNGTGYGFPEHAVIVRNEVNLGFAVACNQGAKVATGRVLVFLNVDAEPQSSWLPPLVHALDDSQIGMAGSKLVYPDGSIQHSGIEFYKENGIAARNRHDDHASGRVEGVTGACLAMRAETFHDCGGFDEGFYNGYDDVDLCLTVQSLGLGIWYCADSVVIHHESVTGPERWVRCAENVDRLQQKWGDEGIR